MATDQFTPGIPDSAAAAQRTHELAAGFDRSVQEKKALTVTKVFVDQGKYLYLSATKHGSIELAEPVYVRLGWVQFLQLVGHVVMSLCGMRPT